MTAPVQTLSSSSKGRVFMGLGRLNNSAFTVTFGSTLEIGRSLLQRVC